MPRRFRLLTMLGLLLVAAVFLIRLMPRERLLMARSQQVANVAKWVGADSIDVSVLPHTCFWLSDHDVLFFRPKREFQAEAFRLNTQTHQETPLTEFNQKLGERLGTVGVTPPETNLNNSAPTGWELLNPHLSPDRKRFLWMVTGGGTEVGRFCASLDGTSLCSWPGTKYPMDLDYARALWLPDNRRWLEISMLHASEVQTKGRLIVRWQDMQMPGKSVKQALPLGNAPDLPQRAWQEPLGVTPDNRLILLPMYVYGPKLTLAAWNLARPDQPAMPLFLNMPNVGAIDTMTLSADGKRLAFACELEARVPGPSLIAAALRKFGMKDRKVNALCVCNLDGSDFHEIGHFLEAPNGAPLNAANGRAIGFTPAPKRPLYDLQWLPDGKRLSFCHGETLYTIAAD